MNCKKCGSPLTANEQFCKNCGTSVAEVNVPNQMPQNMSFGQPTMGGQVGPVVQPTPAANVYNNGVGQTLKKNNNTAIIIVGVIIAVAVFAAILTGILILGKDKEPVKEPNSGEVDTPTNNNDPVEPTPAKSTYTVKSNGFTFKVPDDLIYQESDGMLMVGDAEETWIVAIESAEGSYSQIAKNKSVVKSNMESYGYTVENVSEENIGGVDYLLYEVSYSGDNVIIGYTAANSMYVFGFTLYDVYNEYNYDAIEELSPIFANAKYNGESNSMDASLNVDLGQMLEGAK